jgi:hypothetical protein
MNLHFKFSHFDSRSWQGDTKNLTKELCAQQNQPHVDQRPKDSRENVYLFLLLGYLRNAGGGVCLATESRRQDVSATIGRALS